MHGMPDSRRHGEGGSEERTVVHCPVLTRVEVKAPVTSVP